MTDTQILAWVITFYYLWDCLLWAPARTYVFAHGFTGKWAPVGPLELLKRRNLQMHLLPLIPPAGQVHCGSFPPLSFSDENVVAFTRFAPNPGTRSAQSAAMIPWKQIESIRSSGPEIHVNHTLFFKASNSVEAMFLAKWMQRIRKAKNGKRGEAIQDYLKEIFHKRKAKDRINETTPAINQMKWLSTFIFLLLFIITPAAHWKFGLVNAWIPLLATGEILMWLQGFLFFRLQKKHFPEADQERFVCTLSTALTPPGAIRAPDHVSKYLLFHTHPLIPASLLLDTEQKEKMAGWVLRDLHHSLSLPEFQSNSEALETIHHFHDLLKNQTEKFLKNEGFKLEELLQPPVPSEKEHCSFCPRCTVQYITKKGTCEDCGGIKLAPLALVEKNPKD
ncbi:hypothetical protein N9B94_04320 [Verrucomicrobia bacterium]|nr:hypothetical protein [Verrucomicrobiota bacterium]